MPTAVPLSLIPRTEVIATSGGVVSSLSVPSAAQRTGRLVPSSSVAVPTATPLLLIAVAPPLV